MTIKEMFDKLKEELEIEKLPKEVLEDFTIALILGATDGKYKKLIKFIDKLEKQFPEIMEKVDAIY